MKCLHSSASALVAIVFLSSLPARAETIAEIDAKCAVAGAGAALIMKARQENLPVAKLMNGLTDPVHRAMILEAYESPAYLTDDSKERAVAEFRDAWTVACYRSSSAN